MATTVADIIGLMERLAPPRLAEEWDPIGLQVGHREWAAERVWVALDPLPAVVAAACRENIDLLITHHPLILSPLRNLDCSRLPGSILAMALQHRLAVFAAHTNYDSAPGGLNDLLAARIGLHGLRPLQPAAADKVKLSVYVPGHCERPALDCLLAAGAERVESRMLGLRRARFVFPGPPDSYTASSKDPLVWIEARIGRDRLSGAIDELRARNGCENAPLEVLPVEAPNGPSEAGLGRIGSLDSPRSLAALARHVKERLNAGWVRIAGDPNMRVHHAAVCSGSGSGLLPPFLASEAQAYITGDFKYHQAREIEAAGKGLIDAGHFATEHIMVQSLAERLGRDAAAAGIVVKVQVCELETDAFTAI